MSLVNLQSKMTFVRLGLSLAVTALAAQSLTACGPGNRPDVEELDLIESDPTTRDRPVADRPTGEAGEAGASMDVMDGGDVIEPVTDGSTDAMDSTMVIADGNDVPSMDSQRDAMNSEIPVIVGSDAFDEGVDNCDQMHMLRSCMTDANCTQPQEKCLPSGCGPILRCQPAGRACTDNRDCLAGTQTCTNNTCVAVANDCGDVRACPLGFACEGAAGARRCINRRRRCEQTRSPCPYNDVCIDQPGLAPFCALVATRCATNRACFISSTCVDVDGDGLRECAPGGPCGPGMCADPADRCEILPVDYFLHCGRRGICSAMSGCAMGYSCVDPWGAGVGQCRANTDLCRTNDMCAPNQICYEPDGMAMPGSPSGCR
jgi:hypothetical protein